MHRVCQGPPATPRLSPDASHRAPQLGLLGVTVLHSSGDRGVAGRNNLCLNPDGTVSTAAKIFSPSFPGVCPFITSVGATQVNPGAKVGLTPCCLLMQC